MFNGCVPPDGRLSLSGTVTIDGQPLSEGNIKFIPLSGTSGPPSGTAVSAGRFAIDSAAGTFPGNFRVEITANRKTGRTIQRPPLNMPVDEYEQYLPAKYNTNSELQVDVVAGQVNEFDFPLVLDSD